MNSKAKKIIGDAVLAAANGDFVDFRKNVERVAERYLVHKTREEIADIKQENIYINQSKQNPKHKISEEFDAGDHENKVSRFYDYQKWSTVTGSTELIVKDLKNVLKTDDINFDKNGNILLKLNGKSYFDIMHDLEAGGWDIKPTFAKYSKLDKDINNRKYNIIIRMQGEHPDILVINDHTGK